MCVGLVVDFWYLVRRDWLGCLVSLAFALLVFGVILIGDCFDFDWYDVWLFGLGVLLRGICLH